MRAHIGKSSTLRRVLSSSVGQTVRLSLEDVHRLCTETLTAAGLHEASTRATADTITAAERDGCKSHGLFRLPHIFDGIRLGKVHTTSVPVVHDTAPGALRVDAQCGLSSLGTDKPREPKPKSVATASLHRLL